MISGFFCGILVAFSATKVAGNCWLFYANSAGNFLFFPAKKCPDWALFSSCANSESLVISAILIASTYYSMRGWLDSKMLCYLIRSAVWP